MICVQVWKKTSAILKVCDLQESFIKRIERMVSGFSEGRIVFDCWLESSLKNKKQKKKIHNTCWVPDTSGNEAHHVHQGPSVIVKVQKHAGHFIRQWIIGVPLQQHSHQAGRGLRYNKIRYPNCEEEHTHEEADTLITNQVLRLIDAHLSQDICVSLPDTDVLVLLLDLVSRVVMETWIAISFLQARPQTRQTTERLMLFRESKRMKYTSVKVSLDCTTSQEPTGEGSLLLSRRSSGWKLT